MRIIGLINETSGPCYHRIYTPLMNMDVEEVHVTNMLTDQQLKKGCDILFISRFAFYNTLDQIEAWRKIYGFKLVVDVDDYWYLDQTHILAKEWKENDVSTRIIQYLITADYVICTHDRLAAEVKKLNSNVLICPNAIPGGFEQFNPKPESSDKVRLMWQGSITHRHDLELLRQPMKRLLSLKDRISTTFAGHVKNLPDSDAMLSAFTCGLKLNPTIYEGTTPEKYYHVYNHADICIIPLVESRFNSHKSNLKILEAAYMGIPVIVSKVNPYLGFGNFVRYVENQTDWYKHIRELVLNKELRRLLGKSLQRYCDKHYNFKKINATRLETFKQLTNIHNLQNSNQ